MPSLDEVFCAMRKLHAGTAGGQSEIAPELVVCGGSALHARIHLLVKAVWERGTVVADWRDAEIVPIPKKGDLRV